MTTKYPRSRIAGTLFAARLVYAYNWYAIGAVLPLIQASLRVGPAALGVVLGAFLVGVGIFQLPAGIVALRFGSRAASILGLACMGAAALASGFSPNLQVLIGTRFIAGVGAAFFFAPGLSLITRYYPAGQRGPAIGLYNGAFSIGGAVGLFAGAGLGAALGWQFTLAIGGAILLPMAFALMFVAPPEPTHELARLPGQLARRSWGVLRSRSLWALAFALTGFWGAVYIVAQYLVQFAHDVRPEWGTGVAAAVAGGVVLLSFPGGPFGGWLGERSKDRRVLLAVFGALTGLLVLAVPFAPLIVVVPALLALGFFDGLVFAVQYLAPAYFAEGRGEGMALAIAFINSVQVLVGSGLAILFGILVEADGYTVAWIFAALVTLAFLPLLLLVERQHEEGPGRVIRSPRPRAQRA